jgi:hypothetical protein
MAVAKAGKEAVHLGLVGDDVGFGGNHGRRSGCRCDQETSKNHNRAAAIHGSGCGARPSVGCFPGQVAKAIMATYSP